MFHFPGFAPRGRYPTGSSSSWRVSPFGHLRITGYKPPPRSFSQVSHVLHRHPKPRHPPCTLNCLLCGDLYTTIIICTLITPRLSPRGFHLPLLPSLAGSPTRLGYSYVKCHVSPRNENRPVLKQSGFRALARLGLTAYPLLLNRLVFAS